MHHVLIIASRVVAGIVGVVAFYLAFFLYENEEGIWQNRLENLWIGISDRAKMTHSTATALFNKLAETFTDYSNRLFGKKLLSLQSIGTSTTLSMAPVVFSGFAVLFSPNESTLPFLLLTVFLPIAFAVCLPIAFVVVRPDNVRHDEKPTHIWQGRVLKYGGFLFVLLISVGLIVFGIGSNNPAELIFRESGLPVAILFSFLSDCVTIAFVRKLLAPISNTLSITRIIVTMCGLFVLGALMLSFPAAIMTILPLPGTFLFVPMNFATSLYCFLPLLLLVVILLHRIMWPILARIIYPLCRYKFFTNRKMLIPLGALCLTFAFNLERVGLKELMKMVS
jgi:hypothetical protein